MESANEVLAIGDVVAERYLVERRIGRGGMGSVFEAKDQRLGRQVALKALASTFANDAARQRLEAEARAVASLDHGGIVTLYDVVAHGAETVLVMELVVGESLGDLLAKESIDPHEVARLVSAVADALAAAHARGLVHRDVKPDNIMRRADGRIALLDFGIAKATERDSSASLLNTSAGGGGVIGTPAYLAPEQALGEAVTSASDQFALAVLAYELLTGALPWRTDNLAQLVADIVGAEPPAISSLQPSLDPAVDTVIARALEKSPQKRFPDIRDFATALGEVLGDTESRNRNRSPLSATLTGNARRSNQETIITQSGPVIVARRRRFRIGAAVVASALVIGGVATAIHLRNRSKHEGVSASSSATATVSSMQIPQLPPSKTASASAVQKYEEAMRALSVSNARRARDLFDGAIKDDPQFASALLQRAYLGLVLSIGLDEPSRAAYRNALTREADLSVREAAFLHAIGPSFVDPPNWRDTAGRLEALDAASPDDEQAFVALAVVRIKLGEADKALKASERALAINPKSGMASLFQGQMTLEKGDAVGARKLFAACVEAMPDNVSCRASLGILTQATGACAETDRIGRELTSLVPENPLGYELRAAASSGLGSPEVAIRELLDQRVAALPEPVRAGEQAFDAYRLARRQGNFNEALRALAKQESTLDASNPEILGLIAHARASVLFEMGEPAKAAAAAGDFLSRAASRALPERPFRDPTPRLLAYAHAGGGLDDVTYRKRRDEWTQAWRARSGEGWEWEGNAVWSMAYSPVGDLDAHDAGEALSLRKDFHAETQPMLLLIGTNDSNANYFTGVGAIFLFAAELDEAKTYLRTATSVCTVVPDVRAHYLLGTLYEKQGDHAAACDELATVERIWGRATPRSVTAEAARALAKKCPAVSH